MTQIKEKTGICKAVVIATVVAIRDVVKNGFHCFHILRIYANSNPMHLSLTVFDGVPRTQQQIQASGGGLIGEVDRDGEYWSSGFLAVVSSSLAILKRPI